MQAALAGHGVALARVPLVFEALQRGELVEPFGEAGRIDEPVLVLDAGRAGQPLPPRGGAVHRLGRGGGQSDARSGRRQAAGVLTTRSKWPAGDERGLANAALAASEDRLENAALGDDERERDVVRPGREGGDVELGEGPGDADRHDVRVRGEPAVVVAAAEAEAVAGAGEADAGHDDDVGNDRRAVARPDAALVDPRRRAAVPAPEFHRAWRAPCIWQGARGFVERRVGSERGRCVKFRA